MNAWYDQNTDIVGDTRVPKLSIYGDPDFEKMTAPQRRFYDKVMEIKADLDSMLPEGVTSIDNAVQIRKDLVERIQNASGVKGGVREVVKVSRILLSPVLMTLASPGPLLIQEETRYRNYLYIMSVSLKILHRYLQMWYPHCLHMLLWLWIIIIWERYWTR